MGLNLGSDWSGIAIPVALVDEPASAHLEVASQYGQSTLLDGWVVNSLDLLAATIGSDPAPPCTFFVVIVNSLSTPLTLVASEWRHGSQGGYPAVTNQTGGKTGLNGHQIPAARFDPLNPGSMMHGVGVYGFADDGAGCAGAMEFSYKAKGAGPLVATSWKYLEGSSRHQAGVTADRAAKYGDVSDFYDKTADASNGLNNENGAETIVWGTIGVAALQDDAMIDREYGCLTVWVRSSKS